MGVGRPLDSQEIDPFGVRDMNLPTDRQGVADGQEGGREGYRGRKIKASSWKFSHRV